MEFLLVSLLGYIRKVYFCEVLNLYSRETHLLIACIPKICNLKEIHIHKRFRLSKKKSKNRNKHKETNFEKAEYKTE
jgi:hypothetical protein